MAIKVTVTVEITTGGPSSSEVSTQTFTEFSDLLTAPADKFAAAVVEHRIADRGAAISRKVAALYGEIRDDEPEHVGARLRSRPLTGTR